MPVEGHTGQLIMLLIQPYHNGDVKDLQVTASCCLQARTTHTISKYSGPQGNRAWCGAGFASLLVGHHALHILKSCCMQRDPFVGHGLFPHSTAWFMVHT